MPMRRKFKKIFIKTFLILAPLNALLGISPLILQEGTLKETLQSIFLHINSPTALYIINFATGFLKSPKVDWYIAAPLLSLICSFLWAFIISLGVNKLSKNT
jgi:hypothetical protein